MELPYERQAMRAQPMPDGLSLEDQLMYQSLSILYARYKRNELTRAQATAEKGKLVYEYDRRNKIEAASSDLTKWHTELRKAIEAAQCRYRKEHTLEAADALSAALDGRILHDREKKNE